MVDEEGEEEGEEDFELGSAHSSIGCSWLSSPSVEHLNSPILKSSSLTLSRASLLVIRKRAIEQATKEAESNLRRWRTRRVINFLKGTVEQIIKEMRATRQLIAQKSF